MSDMLVVSNWKAYVEETTKAKALFAAGKRAAGKRGKEIVLAPPAPYLALIAANRTKVKFASQDLSLVDAGAHTGETTAAALVGAGATYAIIGHSERRAAGETDAIVSAKVKTALTHKLTPIVCIGEQERDQDARYLGFLREQLAAVFVPLSDKERAQVIIAYEPIWAIGEKAVGAITPGDLAELVRYIRKVLGDYVAHPEKARIIYGGSVNPQNIRELADEGGIDGFLIGRASVEVASYSSLIKALS